MTRSPSFDPPYPAVQIYQVAGAQAAAVVQPAADTLRVYGAPESMITLANEGLLGDRPVLLNADGAGQPVAGSVVTDSLRRRVVNFGELRTNYSPTLTAAQPADTFLSTDDYTEPGWSKYQAVAQYAGIKNVTASSSASDITTFASQWATGTLPYAAFDGNLATMWESGSFDGPLGQWIQVDLTPIRSAAVRPQGRSRWPSPTTPAIGPPVTKVTVSHRGGPVHRRGAGSPGKLQPLQVPAGASAWLRITVTGLGALPSAPLLGTQVGIAERRRARGIREPDDRRAARSPAATRRPSCSPRPSRISPAACSPRGAGCARRSSSQRDRGTVRLRSRLRRARPRNRGRCAARRCSPTRRWPTLTRSPAGTSQSVTASSTYTADLQDQPRAPSTATRRPPGSPARPTRTRS